MPETVAQIVVERVDDSVVTGVGHPTAEPHPGDVPAHGWGHWSARSAPAPAELALLNQ
ncbi:MAG: hypothetical protein ACRDPJ_04710 [Nocardioidaceae bacterium]